VRLPHGDDLEHGRVSREVPEPRGAKAERCRCYGFGSTVTPALRFNRNSGTSVEPELLADMVAAGKITPAIDREYPLHDVVAAVDYLGAGHARAKIVVALE
jgi:NADPH:quinone reductase-like Zn-dependent oxidoreductase